MTDNNPAEEKSVVGQLSFSAKTAKRISWEAWEFSICGPNLVKVTNTLWGFKKYGHSYTVGIKKWDGQPGPAECGCKADQYQQDYDCKHKVVLASIGGPVVMNAAVNAEAPPPALSSLNAAERTTLGDKLETDGGVSAEETPKTASKENTTTDARTYTYYHEPAQVGGQRYVRCETECIPPESVRMAHKVGCPEGDR